MFPRSGSSLSLSIGLTPPYSLFNNIDYSTADKEEMFSWVEYHKIMFDATFYQKLTGNLVFQARAHFGFIDTYSEKAPTGPFDRFQMGGDGLAGGNGFLLGYDVIGLRGYENNIITPPYYGKTNVVRDETVGGVAFNKYVLELRYPVTLSPQSTIYVLAFAEAGNNFHDTSDFNPFDSYRSAGFGARIFMPAFGLMGIDWGYGFDTLPGYREPSGAQFHFSIGAQIR
jgi:outer membrane protein insertion porin family